MQIVVDHHGGRSVGTGLMEVTLSAIAQREAAGEAAATQIVGAMGTCRHADPHRWRDSGAAALVLGSGCAVLHADKQIARASRSAKHGMGSAGLGKRAGAIVADEAVMGRQAATVDLVLTPVCRAALGDKLKYDPRCCCHRPGSRCLCLLGLRRGCRTRRGRKA